MKGRKGDLTEQFDSIDRPVEQDESGDYPQEETSAFLRAFLCTYQAARAGRISLSIVDELYDAVLDWAAVQDPEWSGVYADAARRIEREEASRATQIRFGVLAARAMDDALRSIRGEKPKWLENEARARSTPRPAPQSGTSAETRARRRRGKANITAMLAPVPEPAPTPGFDTVRDAPSGETRSVVSAPSAPDPQVSVEPLTTFLTALAVQDNRKELDPLDETGDLSDAARAASDVAATKAERPLPPTLIIPEVRLPQQSPQERAKLMTEAWVESHRGVRLVAYVMDRAVIRAHLPTNDAWISTLAIDGLPNTMIPFESELPEFDRRFVTRSGTARFIKVMARQPQLAVAFVKLSDHDHRLKHMTFGRDGLLCAFELAHDSAQLQDDLARIRTKIDAYRRFIDAILDLAQIG